ncbi:HupE/UreJ family protein [Chitinivorax sp. B]|uniref:HupE/UreJ family protein n=1 Tax=Chitinivorax sp. B TaxID=2502235 RepID=UPI0010F4B952|nr:HupE/UreJ family protein [Chitinivorax sp. B]
MTRIQCIGRLLMALLCSAWVATSAQAHKASDSYLVLQAAGNTVTGQWDIALRDLDEVMGLDADQDGQLTWGEVQARHGAIAAYALSRLVLTGNGQVCQLQAGGQQLTRHTDGTYTALPIRADCPAGADTLRIGYRLLFDIDPQHRGLANLTLQGTVRSLLFSPGNVEQQIDQHGLWDTVLAFVGQGTWHIWIGFDHILFLLSLLLPAVLVWRDGRWEAANSLRDSVVDVVRIVTAFTVAHSITLSLATLGVIGLDSRWVESAIAASVLLVAANNVYPFIRGKRWLVAFGFGLIHGFGFAGALAALGLPTTQLTAALASFNIGVELGQLCIVLVFVPLAFALRQRWLYRRFAVLAGSLAIMVLAGTWFIERAFDVAI